jgi:predicted transcriptional regulator
MRDGWPLRHKPVARRVRCWVGLCGVSLGAVNRLEGGEATPRRGTAKKVTDAFLTHGVQIVDEAAYTGAVMVYPRKDA